MALLGAVTAHARHHFWPDLLAYDQVRWRGVLGHRQVTDAYLAALARHNKGKLATFDKGLVALHTDVGVAVDG
jgi:predicted nucleic acid-binding protein